MLKVFLAEDEFVVREGIKNNIDWASHGYEFCGEAADGELAYPMIQRLKPDIVITDIKMPFMDGLELSRLIKKEYPDTEIVILSGYAEFDYAKEAISLGVAHYLTKPISGEELLKEIDAVAVRVEEKKQEKALRDRYEREMAETGDEARRQLFYDIVSGRFGTSQLLESAAGLKMDISAMWYNLILFTIMNPWKDNEGSDNVLGNMQAALQSVIDKQNVNLLDRKTEGIAILVKADSAEELTERIKKIENDFVTVLSEYSNVRYFAGIGTPVNRLRALAESFNHARHAFAMRFLMDESRFLRYDDIADNNIAGMHAEEFDMANVNMTESDKKKVSEFIRRGDRSDVLYFVEAYIDQLKEGAVKSTLFRQYLAMDMYFAAAAFVESIGMPKSELEPVDQNSGVLKNVDKTKEYLVRLIDKAMELRDNNVTNRYGDVIEEVKSYIDENYGDEELSLNMVAAHVGFSPNHLSMVFSQETGNSFIRYLTEYRMNKAMELLRCTGKRSVEISLEVGYKDPHYFSYLFKKTVGMTPTQYRGRQKEEAND